MADRSSRPRRQKSCRVRILAHVVSIIDSIKPNHARIACPFCDFGVRAKRPQETSTTVNPLTAFTSDHLVACNVRRDCRDDEFRCSQSSPLMVEDSLRNSDEPAGIEYRDSFPERGAGSAVV